MLLIDNCFFLIFDKKQITSSLFEMTESVERKSRHIDLNASYGGYSKNQSSSSYGAYVLFITNVT